MDNEKIGERAVYGKLTDFIMYLGSNMVMNMNVMLYTISERYNDRRFFYKEVQYIDKAGYFTRKLTRHIDAFITLENIRSSSTKEFMSLRSKELEFLRYAMIPKLEWFLTNQSELFVRRENNKVYINETKDLTLEKMTFMINISDKNYLILRPGVHKLYNDDLEGCIEVYMNGNVNTMSVMRFNELYGLIRFIRLFDIHTYASSMLNSYMCNDMMGCNLYDMGTGQIVSDISNFKYESPTPLQLDRSNSKQGFFTKNNKKK